MSSIILKIIALITMTVDHAGSILFDDNHVFRFIGRIAFPLYSFMLIEGFNHVKNDKKRLIKYFVSIFIFAVLSEVIYDLALHKEYVFLYSQNIMFSLFVYLVCMLIYEKSNNDFISKTIAILVIFGISICSEALFLSYGVVGFILTIGFYFISKMKTDKKHINLTYVLLIIIYTALYYLEYKTYLAFGVILSLIPILLYNGKKGYNSIFLKYFFYLYYPLHLFILYLISLIV